MPPLVSAAYIPSFFCLPLFFLFLRAPTLTGSSFFLARSRMSCFLYIPRLPRYVSLSAIYRRDFILVVSTVGAILCATSTSTLFPSQSSVMWSFTQTWSSSSLNLNDVIAKWFVLTQVSIDYFNKIIWMLERVRVSTRSRIVIEVLTQVL